MEMENGKRIDAKLCVMHAMNIFTTRRRELFYYFWLHLTSNGNGKIPKLSFVLNYLKKLNLFDRAKK